MKNTTPQERYDAANIVRLSMKLNRKTDADVLQRLGEVESKQGYVKQLVRADIERMGKVKVLIESMSAANCNGGNYPRIALSDGVRVLGVANVCGCHRGCSNTENLATGEWSAYPTEYISGDKMDKIMSAYVDMINALK